MIKYFWYSAFSVRYMTFIMDKIFEQIGYWPILEEEEDSFWKEFAVQ